jgi:pentose-5-phosphate-3-epimerase
MPGRFGPNEAVRIEVDGGVGLGGATALRAAGADLLVAGTSVFHPPDSAVAFWELCNARPSRWTER